MSRGGGTCVLWLINIDVCRWHPGRKPSPNLTLILDFQPPELRESHCRCSSVSPGGLSGQPIRREAGVIGGG